jgi:hypothetical protein
MGTWQAQDRNVIIRFDAEGRFLQESDLARFRAPWTLEGGSTIVTKGYEFCSNCAHPDFTVTNRRLKVSFAGDVLTLTDMTSGGATSYRKVADGALSWNPSGPPNAVEFERKH